MTIQKKIDNNIVEICLENNKLLIKGYCKGLKGFRENINKLNDLTK